MATANRAYSLNSVSGKHRLFDFLIALVLVLSFLSSNTALAAPAAATKGASKGSTAPAAKASSRPASTLQSAKQSPLTPVLVRPKAGGKICLWKVAGESGATLYLLGTIHVFKPEYYPLPAEMEKAFEKARALLVEIDITKSDKLKTQQLLQQKGVYYPPDGLDKHVSSETLGAVQDYCQKNNLPFSNVLRMRPWLVAITIMQMELQRLGYSTNAGIDLHFMHEAIAKGKKIVGLETEEFQLGVFSGFPADLQDLMLKLTLVDLALLKDDAGDMMKTWNSGDEKAMDEILCKDIKEHPELMPVQEKLLYDRNVTMAEKLELYLKGNDTYLAAVGTGHLVGSRSIIELLKQKGYKVSQIVVGEEI